MTCTPKEKEKGDGVPSIYSIATARTFPDSDDAPTLTPGLSQMDFWPIPYWSLACLTLTSDLFHS